jgi:hypothetical protein
MAMDGITTLWLALIGTGFFVLAVFLAWLITNPHGCTERNLDKTEVDK